MKKHSGNVRGKRLLSVRTRGESPELKVTETGAEGSLLEAKSERVYPFQLIDWTRARRIGKVSLQS
jgi:hypothetical protein